MNTATMNLENDHIQILRLLTILEHITNLKEPEIKHIETVVDLIKNYADAFHHAKEEDLLFPLMVKKGFSVEQGPIGVMLHEHKEGRNFVKKIEDNILKYKNGDIGSLQHIYENMHGYVRLLDNHIDKENKILFRMADNILTEGEQNDLLEQFEKVEKSLDIAVTDYVKRIDEIENDLNI